MVLSRPDPAALEAAVRAGEPVHLRYRPDVPDEVVPLCHASDFAPEWLPPPACPSDLKVTAVIPASRHRPIGLAALEAQDCEVEVLVLANGAYGEGVRVPWRGHGRTRQVGVELAEHPYVLFTVDDAIPLGAGFVRTLVEALEEGGHDAVFARQVPWPTSDPVTRARLRRWTPPDGPGEATLDNVAALYRKQALLDDPFDAVDIAEDWAWGRRHRVGYVPRATVVHAHARRFLSAYRRTRDLHRVIDAPKVDAATMVRALPSTVGRDFPGAVGELLGQYVGGRRR
ncbi:MAG: glycosyltransferase [Myxococcota bacterium]